MSYLKAPPTLRILIVTPSIPYPPNWGFGIRVFQIVRQLSQRHSVSVLCYADEGDDDKVAALAEVCHSVHTVTSPLPDSRSKRTAQLLSLLRRSSFQTASVRTSAMQLRATELVSSEKFDLVQFESSQMSWLELPSGLPSIVDEHNIEYELLQRMYQTERSPFRKLYNWGEFRKFRREERASWHRADGCAVTSDREGAILAGFEPHQLIHVAPNGVDITYFTGDDKAVDDNSIVFTGLLSYRPNIDAVTFFTKQVLPLIVRRRPNVVFSIVGLGAPSEVTRLAGPNVRFVGEVPDVRPAVRSAGAFVVPLQMGSGTRLKILEGLSMGKGMVSTTLGCEGIAVRDGQHLLVADDPVAFAEAVLSLLDDRQLAARLGREGRALVEQSYSWLSIVDGLERFHERVLDARR